MEKFKGASTASTQFAWKGWIMASPVYLLGFLAMIKQWGDLLVTSDAKLLGRHRGELSAIGGRGVGVKVKLAGPISQDCMMTTGTIADRYLNVAGLGHFRPRSSPNPGLEPQPGGCGLLRLKRSTSPGFRAEGWDVLCFLLDFIACFLQVPSSLIQTNPFKRESFQLQAKNMSLQGSFKTPPRPFPRIERGGGCSKPIL